MPFSHPLFKPLAIDPKSIIFSDESIYWTVAIKPIIDSIHNGATRLITKMPFTPDLQLKLIEQYKISIIYIATSSLILCLKSELIDKIDVSSVKILRFYGAKWPSSLGPSLKRYFRGADCGSWYGLTEIGRTGSSSINEDGTTSGYRLTENRQAKIIDENGYRCGPGVNGEICFKINNEFFGYLDDPQANAAPIDNEGFFRTGDVGYFDDNGILFIEDRKKNVLNVYYFDSVILPSEMEDCLIAVLILKKHVLLVFL